MVKKAVDVEIKANLQPPSGTKEIDFKYLKNYKSSAKKKKIKPVKSIGLKTIIRQSLTTLCLLIQVSLRPQPLKKKRHKSRQESHLVTGVNATEVAKKNKDKDKTKNLSYIKCYTCKQKSYYANKYPKNSKN